MNHRATPWLTMLSSWTSCFGHLLGIISDPSGDRYESDDHRLSGRFPACRAESPVILWGGEFALEVPHAGPTGTTARATTATNCLIRAT